ncbi:hypothetical protein ALC62_12523 [Cyphomyrmex costatus]|uniref:Uncharacterized protein n=1 Tax=Cyphomyrmex costatus TaxID=456900 RepID=A0A195C983_9HYME|nr:hypothetical protein ALC62_12523 [Cyphomyrmex costatus]
MYVDSRRSESFEDQSPDWSMRRNVLNSTSNKPNMYLCYRFSKGRAVLVDFVLRIETILTSLGPDTILGMVFDLTNRYSSPGCLLLFLNVPHNMFAKCYRNLVRSQPSLRRDIQSYEGGPPLSNPHECEIMSPEESATTCSIASQISTIAQFACNVARCAPNCTAALRHVQCAAT